MDLDNPVTQLCLAGTRAEFEGQLDAARDFYRQAWEAARDDYDACVAAHYVARLQTNPEVALYWNQEALARAEVGERERVSSFYPSLYLNLGHSYEMLGNEAEAQKYYALAAELGFEHQVE